MKNVYIKSKENNQHVKQSQINEQNKKPQSKITIHVEKASKVLSGITSKNVSKEKKPIVIKTGKPNLNPEISKMATANTLASTFHSKNSSINFGNFKEKPKLLTLKEEFKKTIQSKCSDDTRVTVENSLVNSKLVSFKHEKLKKVGSTNDSSVKNSINFGQATNATNSEKETICFRNNIDELKCTINVVTSQSIEKDKDSLLNFKSTIEEKDEIIQKLTSKIQCLENKIKTYENNTNENFNLNSNVRSSKLIKTNKKVSLNNSFLSTKSSSNLLFGKQNNNIPKNNKNILFTVEVSKNIQEKPASKGKLNINVNSLSKHTSPRAQESLLSPKNSNILKEIKVNNYINSQYKKKIESAKTKSFELTNQLNSIRDKTRSVLEKYHNYNLALMVKIRSMSSNNNLIDQEQLELK